MSTMTRAERETLIKIVRSREKVAKADTIKYGARLKADFEAQLDRRYSFDEDEVWKLAMEAAKAAAEKASAAVAKQCDKLGIPRQFQPAVHGPYWASRGRPGVKEERAEMRRVASTEIDARVKEAQAQIAKASVDAQEKIMVTMLDSAEAKEILSSLPRVETMVLLPDVRHVAELMDQERKKRAALGYQRYDA